MRKGRIDSLTGVFSQSDIACCTPFSKIVLQSRHGSNGSMRV